MYRVCWKSLLTGAQGCGAFMLSLDKAQAWVDGCNKAHPEVLHWFERQLATYPTP